MNTTVVLDHIDIHPFDHDSQRDIEAVPSIVYHCISRAYHSSYEAYKDLREQQRMAARRNRKPWRRQRERSVSSISQ